MKILKNIGAGALILAAIVGFIYLIGTVGMSETEERIHEEWLQKNPQHAPIDYTPRFDNGD